MKNLLNSRLIQTNILIAILLFGFLIRTWHLNFPVADWHSWRQADTASVSRIYVDESINVLMPRYYDVSRIQTGILNPLGLRMVEFPVYNVLHATLEKNFHIDSLPVLNINKTLLKQKKNPISVSTVTADSFTVWGRLVSILSAVTTAYFLFLLGKRFTSSDSKSQNYWGGLLAAFFYLFIPYNIFFTRVILPEPIGVTFLIASLYFFVRFIDKEKVWALLLAGALFSLSTLIKPFMFFYSPIFIYLLFQKYGFNWIYKRTSVFIFAIFAIVPFFVWRMWVNNFPEGIPHFDWAFNSDKIRFRPSFWFWLFGERIGKLILGMWGLIPFGFGLVTIKKNNLFNLIFFLGSILYVTLVATASVRHDYYQILIVPSICLLLAQGTVFLWNSQSLNKYIARPLTIFAIFMMLLLGYYQAREYYKINHYEIIEAGRAVQRLTPKNAVVIAPYNGDTAFLYHTNRFGYPVIDESVEEMIERGATIYVSVNFDNDANQIMKKYKVIEKTDKYVVVDLTKKTSTSKIIVD